jgi:hypothetical protein
MPEQESSDRVRTLLEGYAEGCLARLSLTGDAPRPDAVVRESDGRTVLLVTFPTPPGGQMPRLTECDRNCLSYLAAACEPLSAARLRKALEKERSAIHGLITVKRSLSKLKRMGLVACSRRRPRGHFIPEGLPLLQRLFRK